MKDTKPRLIRMKDHEALLAEARAADAARIAELEALVADLMQRLSEVE